MAGLLSTLISGFLLLAFASPVLGGILFSTLPQTLLVSASPKANQVLMVGEDNMTVTWRLNSSVPAGGASQYKTAKVRLCYAPVSQFDRGWRKTNNDLAKDKTCQFAIALVPFDSALAATTEGQMVKYAVERDVPTATYFVRVYVLDGAGKEVAYGQSTDGNKAANLFEVKGISGRHASIDVAAACFSAASIVALVGFFVVEMKKGKK